MLIRQASLSDLQAMQLILRSTKTEWSEKVLQDCFGESYLQWVISNSQKNDVGFAIVKNNGDRWELMQIVIQSHYQHQGFATQLLLYICDEARKNKINVIQLEVRASNATAIHLYEKSDFKRVGIRTAYYKGEDAILMDKNIATN